VLLSKAAQSLAVAVRSQNLTASEILDRSITALGGAQAIAGLSGISYHS
jgi:hypothetical protein